MDEREESILRNVDRLIKAKERGSFEDLAREAARKRLEWYDACGGHLDLAGSPVRKAYTLLLIRYLRLNPSEVPVVYEDETKIVWRSSNFCPLLEACNRLGMDTREVCRLYQELPAQELISKVDPHLKFTRNYDRIRPQAPYCEETIELKRASSGT